MSEVGSSEVGRFRRPAVCVPAAGRKISPIKKPFIKKPLVVSFAAAQKFQTTSKSMVGGGGETEIPGAFDRYRGNFQTTL